MSEQIIRTANGMLLRTDVVSLQHGLMECATLASKLLNSSPGLSVADKAVLMDIVRVANATIFVVREIREDNELELVKNSELPLTTVSQ